MRPSLKDVIRITLATGKSPVYFSLVLGEFKLLLFPTENSVRIDWTEENVRKKVKKGLDELELRTTESRKAANEYFGIRSNNRGPYERSDSD